jgi:hypothetical protein
MTDGQLMPTLASMLGLAAKLDDHDLIRAGFSPAAARRARRHLAEVVIELKLAASPAKPWPAEPSFVWPLRRALR